MAKTIKTIKINNGVIELKSDGNWYRNGKRFTKNGLSKYKLYSPKYKGYVKLSGIDISANTPTLDKLHNKLWDISSRREKIRRFQTYDAPIKDNQKVSFRTKGALNLLDVPYQLLDSIAKNAGRARLPFDKALGLAAKETTIGNKSKALMRAAGLDDEAIQYELDNFTYNNKNIINNHAFDVSMYSDYLGAIYKKYFEPLYKDKDRNSDDVIKASILAERQAAEDVKYNTIKETTPHYSDNAMVDGFRRYLISPNTYNPGQANYVPMVDNLAKEAWNDKSLQEYWNKQGKKYYQQGLDMPESTMSQYKFGGRINKRRKAEYGKESIALPEAEVVARKPRWYNKLGKVLKQTIFPNYNFILNEDGRYVVDMNNPPEEKVPYSKQHDPFNFSTTGGTIGHERDNIINVQNTKAGERDFLQMMGLSKLAEGKYLYKNRNKSETDKREYLKWCAENANMMNRNFGKPTAGDAWTRHGVYGDSAIVVNPNVDKRNYSETWGLNFNRVNKDNAQYVENNIDNVELQSGDIVDIAKKSAFERKAYKYGDFNRANSHTGTIINRNGNTYVFHYDGEGKIKMDPIGDLIGNSIWNPSMITGIRRPGTKKHPYTDKNGNIVYNKKQFGGMKKYNPRHKAFIGAIINAATSTANGIANAVMQHKQQLKQNRQDNYDVSLQTAGVLDQLFANQDVVNQQLRNKVNFKFGGRKKCELGGLGKGILFSALTGAGGIAGAFADRAMQKHDANILTPPQLDKDSDITKQRFGGRTQLFMCGGRTKRNSRR